MLQQCRCFAMDLFCVFFKGETQGQGEQKSQRFQQHGAHHQLGRDEYRVYTQKLLCLNLFLRLGRIGKGNKNNKNRSPDGNCPNKNMLLTL